MTSNDDTPEEFSIAALVKNCAAASKRPITKARSDSGKSRNFVKPVKPLFEGKSIEEAMPRRNSDSTVSSHRIRTFLDDDEVSLSSVQNLETIPSVSESVGILSIISSNFRKTRSITEQHIGELSDRRQLQEKLSKLPIAMTDIQQSSGVYGSPSRTSERSGRHDESSDDSKRGLSTLRPSLLNSSAGSGPKRKDSLGLFRGASLRNLIKQADSNHRRMVALEDSEDDITDHDKVEANNNVLSSPSTSTRQITPKTPTPVAEESTDKDNSQHDTTPKQGSKLKKRNSSFSGSIKSPDLRKAKERMRGSRRTHSSLTSNSNTAEKSSSSRKSGSSKMMQIKSPVTRSSSSGSIGMPSKAAVADDQASLALNDSFAWMPIVHQSNSFFDSFSKMAINEADSQRGYCSDSSEYQHKRSTRWHMSKEGRQIKERIRQQSQALAETRVARTESGHEKDLCAEKKNERTEVGQIQNEWHDVSGIAIKQTEVDKNSEYYRRPIGVSESGNTELFRGRSLQDALPEQTRKVKGGADAFNFVDSMPSLATITDRAEEGSLSCDAFTRLHHSKLDRDGPRSADGDQDKSPAHMARDPRQSILKKYRRSLEALDLEQSNHETYSMEPIQSYRWTAASSAINPHLADERCYPSHQTYQDPLTVISTPNSQNSGLQATLEGIGTQKSEHSEASSMGESHLIANTKDPKEHSILQKVNQKALALEARGAYKKKKDSLDALDDKCGREEAKKKIRRMDKALRRVTKDTRVSEKDADPPEQSLGWQRLIQDIHRLPNKKIYSSQDHKEDFKMSANPSKSKKRMTLETPAADDDHHVSPDFDWTSVDVKHSRHDEDYYKAEKRAGAAQVETSVEKLDGNSGENQIVRKPMKYLGENHCGADIISNDCPRKRERIVQKGPKKEGLTATQVSVDKTDGLDSKKNFGASASSNSVSQCSGTDGPFCTRPTMSQYFANNSDTFNDRCAEPVTINNSDEEDDKSTQSVDRHLVRESSHRRLLRKQVSDRREFLQSILSGTKRPLPIDEDDVLTLKRKLAISQSLVQKLEVEKSQIERKAVLDVASAQATLLEQRNKRELELEQQIKRLMKERNLAVEECHQLRIHVSQSCDGCKRRFDESRSYFMDHYIRHTIVSKEFRPRGAAFEWFTGKLSIEALDLETDHPQRNAWGHDQEMPSAINSMIPEFDTTANAKNAPLTWLSERLFATQEEKPLEGLLGKSIECSQKRNPVKLETFSPDSISKTSAHGNRISADDTLSEREMESKRVYATSTDDQHVESHSKKKGFFASLLGEKVTDEFSSLGLPQQVKDGSGKTPNKFSLFGSLRGEEVKEESLELLLGRPLATISKERGVMAAKSARVLGLKNEQVLDDMALIDSLAISGSNLKSHLDASEKVGASAPMTGVKGRSFSRLQTEIVDQDQYDELLLSPRQNCEGTEKSHKLNSPSNTTQQMLTQPLDGSEISSPFTWKRNRGSSKEKRSKTYLGKYRNASTSSYIETPGIDRIATDVDDQEASPIKPSLNIFDTRTSPIKYMSRPSDDVEERPWKAETEDTIMADLQTMPSKKAGDINIHHGNKDCVADEIDQVATLLAKENSAWE